MPSQREYWEKSFRQFKDLSENEKITYDNWLEDYLSTLKDHKSSSFLDLGCGLGYSTYYLLNHDFKVISVDISHIACNWMKKILPDSLILQCDFLSGLPFKSNTFQVIVADSSLHYFYQKEFERILDEIYRVLTKNGIILIRVNSTKDTYYGAGQGRQVEKNLYFKQNRYKKFFEKEELEDLFKELNIITLKEIETSRFGLVKHQWELFGKKKQNGT